MKIERHKTIAFTGHRSNRIVVSDEVLKDEIYRTINHQYHNGGYRIFLTGMSEGFDLLAGEVVLDLKQEYEDIRLFCVIPFADQYKRFSVENQQRWKRLYEQSDHRELIFRDYVDRCFLVRNDYLLEHSSLVVAYLDNNPKGGTAYTVRNAGKLQIPVINLYIYQ